MFSTSRHIDKEYSNQSIGHVKPPYAYKDKNFEIVFPKRVNVDSEHISHAMDYYSKDVNSRGEKNNDKEYQNFEDKIYLLIPIAGKNHHLELRPTRSILSPGMVVESFGHSQRSQIQKPNSKIKRKCHFTGKIRGNVESKAALSTCDGLSGYIQTGKDLFMIEPKYKENHSLDYPHPHVLYQPIRDQKSRLFCASEDTDDVLAQRKAKQKRAPQLSFNSELNIEILVVLDQSFLRSHKDIDIENYVLTVFNIAHNLFHDSTLGVNINLAIVRLIRLEVEDHEMNIAMNHNIEKSMHYFRLWQNRINPKEDTHPNHHDLAVLLTRIDICADDKTCGFLGSARYAGLCDPENQAVIAQDSGLLVGHTIAHEIGHTMTMVHDELQIELKLENLHLTNNDQGKSTVMSPHISENVVKWSNCSNERLKMFIDYGFGSCLFDAPTEHSFVMADELPGIMYDGDHQCMQYFGPNAALCMTGVECDNLICYVEDKGCIETHTSPAEGTSCGENKWCFHGECVEQGERPGAVHGEWSAWSEWSECTRTCGSGVASQMRFCNNPTPKFGGRFCDGDNIKYKICSTDPCDTDTASFRDVQCAEFNSWLYPGDGKMHMWKSYPIHDENPCALYCVSEDGNIASLRPRVIDGTTCYRGIRDICINGLCKEIPCDLDLQSSSVEDKCGVCKGDGTTCDVVHGEREMFCVKTVEPEKKIMSIPAGAVNVKIEEMLPSETRIQVRDQYGQMIYIDGDMLGMYNVHGSTAWVGMIRTKQEAISIQGPLNETITIWANVQQNSTLRYAYGVPATTKRKPVFSWDYLDWSSCSAECGPGLQTSTAKCVEKSSGLVDESYCDKASKPKAQSRSCEITACVPRWFVGEWGECIGCHSGTRTRLVKCYKPVGNGEGELDFIADNQCANNKPSASEHCNCKRDKRDGTTPIASSISSSSSNSRVTTPIGKRDQSSTETLKSSTVPGSTVTEIKVTGGNMSTSTVVTVKEQTAQQAEEYEDSTSLVITTPLTIPPPKVKTMLDFVNIKKKKLTVHTELELQNYPKGLPHPKHSNDTKFEFFGKDALKFMNTLQHDFSNNKTKI